MLKLFTVDDCFELEGRGCVLVPGLPTKPGDPNLKIGARIRLKTPLGKEIDTFVKGIEMINYRKMPDKIRVPILLPREITKKDVPAGTEVFLLEEKFETIKQQNT